MRRWLLRALLAAGGGAAALTGSPSLANDPGYNVWFAGNVLSVDAQRGRLRIARGPTETSGRGVEECVVASGTLKSIRPGMLVEAQADTRRRPWRVLHLRIMKRKPASPGTTPVVAAIRITAPHTRVL